jgi:hypothetical protein
MSVRATSAAAAAQNGRRRRDDDDEQGALSRMSSLRQQCAHGDATEIGRSPIFVEQSRHRSQFTSRHICQYSIAHRSTVREDLLYEDRAQYLLRSGPLPGSNALPTQAVAHAMAHV